MFNQMSGYPMAQWNWSWQLNTLYMIVTISGQVLRDSSFYKYSSRVFFSLEFCTNPFLGDLLHTHNKKLFEELHQNKISISHSAPLFINYWMETNTEYKWTIVQSVKEIW